MAIGSVGAFVALVWSLMPPDVEFCWVDSNGRLPVAAPLPAERWIPLGIADLYRHRVRLPVLLGIRNGSWAPLANVAVTIEYPHLNVESTAQHLAMLDSTVVIEHKVGTLLPGRAFTAIGDADEVIIPVDSLLSGAMIVDGAGLPQYIEFTREWPQQPDTSHVLLVVSARVSADGKLRQGVWHGTVPMWLEQQSWWPPPIPMKERPATASEAELFSTLFKHGEGRRLFSGALTTTKTGRRVRWQCFDTARGRFSEYSIDGVPVRVQADTNFDWLVDYELLSRPAGRGHVTVTIYTLPRPMDLPMIPVSRRPPLPGELATR